MTPGRARRLGSFDLRRGSVNRFPMRGVMVLKRGKSRSCLKTNRISRLHVEGALGVLRSGEEADVRIGRQRRAGRGGKED